jgi:hypothetical protein
VKTHKIRIIASGGGRYFVADEDNNILVESRYSINDAARELMKRHFASRGDVLVCYMKNDMIGRAISRGTPSKSGPLIGRDKNSPRASADL